MAGSPGHSQSPPAGGGSSGMGSRRGSISSLSSVTSMLEEKDDEKIRCCHHCMDTLLKRQQKLEEKDHVPDVVKLYEVKGTPAVSAPFFSFFFFVSMSRSVYAGTSFPSFIPICLLGFPVVLSVKPCPPDCQRLRMCMEKVDEKAPDYIRMAESLK